MADDCTTKRELQRLRGENADLRQKLDGCRWLFEAILWANEAEFHDHILRHAREGISDINQAIGGGE